MQLLHLHVMMMMMMFGGLRMLLLHVVFLGDTFGLVIVVITCSAS
jgi:hypothetical protein